MEARGPVEVGFTGISKGSLRVVEVPGMQEACAAIKFASSCRMLNIILFKVILLLALP